MAVTTGRRAVAVGMVVVGVGTLVGNGVAYLLGMIAARVLAPAEFGAFGALLGLSIIVATLGIALQAVGARRVAVADPGLDRPAVEGQTLRLSVLVAVGIAAGSLVLAWPLSTLLDMPGAALLMGLLGMAFYVVGSAPMGIAQGREQHTVFSMDFMAIGVARAGLGIVGVVVTASLYGAAAGILVGCAIGALIAYRLTCSRAWASQLAPGMAGEFGHVAHALLVLYTLTNIDVILARVFLTPDQSGEYSVGVLLAKIAFFLPNAVLIVLFPRMAAGKGRKALFVAAGLTAAIGLVITAVSFVLGPLVIRILGGTQYPELGGEAWLFALEGSAFALVQVLLYARLAAQDRRAVALVWAALLALVAIVSLWRHGSVVEIVTTVVVVSLVPVAVALWLDWRRGGVDDEVAVPIELAE